MVARQKIGSLSVGLVAFLLATVTALLFSFAAEQADLDRWARVLADAKADTVSRLEAARRLGEARDPRYLHPLTEALRDGRKAVRWAAVEALWELGDERAVPALIDYLGKGEGYDWGKVLTMNALGSLKDPRAIEPLAKMLESESPFLRRSAALALVRIGDERAIPAMIRVLKDQEGWLQRLAHELLIELTRGKISGESPSGYDGWTRWHQGGAQHLKIEGAKKE